MPERARGVARICVAIAWVGFAAGSAVATLLLPPVALPAWERAIFCAMGTFALLALPGLWGRESVSGQTQIALAAATLGFCVLWWNHGHPHLLVRVAVSGLAILCWWIGCRVVRWLAV